MGADTAGWSPEHRMPWERVEAHPFENDGVALDVTRRLARTLGWPLDDIRALVEECRRFCVLAVVGDFGAVTPSEEVDRVWRLAALRRPLRAATLGAALAFAATPARGAWASPDWDLAAANPFDLDNPSFLTLYVALLILVALGTWLLRDLARTTDRRPDLRDLGEVELAYCVGGNERAADTLYVALASHGAASLGTDGIVVEGPVPGLPPQLEAFRRALVGARSRQRFLSAFADSTPYGAMLDRLLARKILLAPSRRHRLFLANWLPVALLLAFGLVKVVVGLSRGKPVGFLLFFTVATLVAFAAVLGRERYLTREACASLDSLRDSRSRALRAPLPEELAFAFAMLGTVALDGTAHAGFAKLVRPSNGGGAGGCGTGGDGGGCGGCSG